jgi:hypothetical protein
MFEKRAKTDIKMNVEALHVPTDGAWSFYNTSRIKTASIDKTKKIDLGGFDLTAAVKENPDNLFVKVFAIKANEVNDNGDCFSEKELEKAAHTFIGVPVFVNHQNDNVENARGKVVHAWYDAPMKGIYCINMVDRAAYPRLARGIEEKYINGTSMGAQVGHSLCSICHNKAHTADDFCTHIKNGKNRKISGKYDCKYHESSCKPEDECPIDGCKKGDSHEMHHKEAKVFEWNFDIKFIEDSFVVNPACHDCLVCDILNVDNIKNKVAENISQLKKVASSLSETVDAMNGESLEKTAGKSELQALSQAMNLMEHVARSMMAQKQQIQLDYASDLVEHMAKVQSLLDELTEMGYGRLPSPTEQEIAIGNMLNPNATAATPASSTAQQIMNPAAVGQNMPQPATPQISAAPIAKAPAVSSPSGAQSASLDGLGSVTRPTFVQSSSEIKKDFLKNAKNMNDKLDSVSSELRRSIILLAQRSSEVADSEYVSEYVNGNIRITVANVEGSGIIVGKWKDNRLVSWSSAEEFGDEVVKLASSDPQEAAKIILSQYQKESGVNMSANNTIKTAAADSSQQEVVTQKQLDNAGPLQPRTGKETEVITEAQLEHKGSSPEVITQAQLAALEGDLARWDSFPEVITQGQWDEMSRRVSNTLGEGYTDQITQAQLASLQKSHKWTAPEVITQAQLSDLKKAAPQTDAARVAASAKDLVKAASNTIADAISNYGLSPADISASMNVMTQNPYAQIKAGLLALVNAAPNKVASRLASVNRKNYFGKIASTNTVNAVDGLLAAMGDNIGYNKAEDFVDALKFAVSSKKVFAAAEEQALVKMASKNSDNNTVMSKESMFENAFAEMNRSEDGLYKVCGTLAEDVTVNPDNKAEFMKALHAFASSHIDVPFVIENVNLDKEAGVFEMDCKDHSVCSEDEKTAFANVLNAQFKVASADENVVEASDENDGLYKICGTLTEDVTADPADRNTFMKALYRFAKSHINKPFVIANVDINAENGTFEMDCKETAVCTDAEKTAFASAVKSQFKVASKESSEDDNSVDNEFEKTYNEFFGLNRKARSENRTNMLKQAQFGGPAGGMGAAAPAGGGGGMMGGADAAGGMPGAEALSTPPAAPAAAEAGLGGADAADDTDMQPKPPGTVCVVCGSSDVDVLEGKCRCNNCKAEFAVKVNIDITKYPSVLDSGEKKKEEGGDKGEGFAMPEAKEPASMPVAAMTRLNNSMIKVAQDMAKAQGKEWSLGSISPFTGNISTMKLEGNKFMCLDTGRTFEVHVAGVDKGGKKAVFAEWRYDAIPLNRECDVCNRKKIAFNNALKAHGIDEETFDSMLLTEKGKTILAMNAKGLFKNVKTASSDNVISGLQKTAGFGSKFPIETCMEKIARKFGENAVAMSGPCEGKPLAECACKKLATAGVYANDLAIKIASVWSVEDQMVNCVEDFVRTAQFNMKEACVVCDQLKNKFAEVHDYAADAMDSEPVGPDEGGTDDTKPTEIGEDDASISAEMDEVDPFAAEDKAADVGGMVTIQLPKDILENLDAALDKAMGENPAEEAHHGGMVEEVKVETPVETAEEATPAIEKAVGTEPKAMDAFESAAKETAGTDEGMPVEESSEKEIALSSEEDEECEECDAHEKSETSEEEHEEHETHEEEESEHGKEEGKEEKEEVDHDHAHDSKPEFLKKTGDEDEDEGDDDGDDDGDGPKNKDTEEEDSEMEKAASTSQVFKKGRISGTGEINLDLSNVMQVLASQGKQVKQAKEVTLKNVQDSAGKIQDGKTMGHEPKFEMNKPEIPEGDKKALMGGEADAGLDVVKNMPEFDAGNGEMGHEKELGYTSEKTHEATGGRQGAGNHAASSKARTTVLAERIMKNVKTASDKKIEEKKPVHETANVGKVADDKDLADSGNPRKPSESADMGKIDDNSLMGHEKETINEVPKAEKDGPSIPVGGGRNEKFDKNEKNTPELQTAVKGTVIAGGDAESLAARKEAAIKVAGRKLKAGLITIDKLASEIEKLTRYEASDLKDIEASLFGASKKGFDTVAKGTEKPLVISEKSNQRKVAQELKDSIESLFTLSKSNDLAQDDPNFELKRNNVRFK